MTAKELAEELNGVSSNFDTYSAALAVEAYKNGLTVATTSDDGWILMVGQINIEVEQYFLNRDDYKLKFDASFNLCNENGFQVCHSDQEEITENILYDYHISAFCDENKIVNFHSNIPHYRFMNKEKDCIGIVFHKDDMKLK